MLFYSCEDHFDLYSFSPVKKRSVITIPEDISAEDFLYFLQGSLDKIKPVLIVPHEDVLFEISLEKLSSTHSKFLSGKVLFLNYSIRNSLSKLQRSGPMVKNFEEIEEFFAEILSKN